MDIDRLYPCTCDKNKEANFLLRAFRNYIPIHKINNKIFSISNNIHFFSSLETKNEISLSILGKSNENQVVSYENPFYIQYVSSINEMNKYLDMFDRVCEDIVKVIY